MEHTHIISAAPSSVRGERNDIIAAHPLGKGSFELLDVFNKTLANESLITFVMLHNPDTKCE